MNCTVRGCTRQATHYLVAKAWALGHTPHNSPALSCVIGLQFCHACAHAEAKRKRLADRQFWQRAENVCRSAGRMPPDRTSLKMVVMRGDLGIRLAATAGQRVEHH